MKFVGFFGVFLDFFFIPSLSEWDNGCLQFVNVFSQKHASLKLISASILVKQAAFLSLYRKWMLVLHVQTLCTSCDFVRFVVDLLK